MNQPTFSKHEGAPALPRLDARLAGLAELVRPNVCCADIGTDHGLLIAWLAASGRIRVGFACDINPKPLKKAAFSLGVYGVENQVTLLLSDGLSALHAGDCDDIVIAGMGSELIWSIIDAAPWTRDPALRFILQPMNRPDRLRRHLYANGFTLLDERPAISGRFAYSVMLVAYTGQCREIDLPLAYGGLLWQSDNPAVTSYFTHLCRYLEAKISGLRRAETPELAAYEQLLAAVRTKEKEPLHDSTGNLSGDRSRGGFFAGTQLR